MDRRADDARSTRPGRWDRREVLARIAAAAAFAGLGPTAWADAVARAQRRAAMGVPPVGPARVLTTEEWATLAAVQETLWPAGDGCPGARDLNATVVLDAALASADTPPVQLRWVRDGLPALHDLARGRGAARFEALDAAGQDAVLVAFRERPEGSGWIRLVLGYTLEAVLGDPVHGGNPGEAGWRFTGYEPGDPRPVAAEGPR